MGTDQHLLISLVRVQVKRTRLDRDRLLQPGGAVEVVQRERESVTVPCSDRDPPGGVPEGGAA